MEGREKEIQMEREREGIGYAQKKENKMLYFFDATNFGQGLRISKVLWANRTRGKPLGDWKIFSYVNLPNVARPSCCYCCYCCCLCLCVPHPQTARTHRQKRGSVYRYALPSCGHCRISSATRAGINFAGIVECKIQRSLPRNCLCYCCYCSCCYYCWIVGCGWQRRRLRSFVACGNLFHNLYSNGTTKKQLKNKFLHMRTTSS